MPPPFSWFHKSFPTAATPVSVVVCVVADNVVPHARLIGELGRTERAVVWPFSRMFPNMFGEMVPSKEPGRTERADVSPLSRMVPSMYIKIVPSSEPGRTHLALVRLIAIVGFSMYIVIRYIVKRGAALLTLPDEFPGVDTSVRRKIVLPCEGLPTNVTNVRLESTVRLKVSRQITLLSKRLSTDVTPKWPLPSVSYLVTRHISHVVCGVLATLTPVPAVPAIVAVTLPHVIVQTILFQTGKVAVGKVELFT